MHSFSNLRKAALHAYIDSRNQRRRIARRRAGLISVALMFVVGSLIFGAAAYSSSAAVAPEILDPRRLGPIASLFPSTSTGQSDPTSSAPAGEIDPSGTLALPSPLPSATPTLRPTATPYIPDTRTPTPTLTATPTVSPTPSQTLTPSPTLTPSETPLGGPLPTSTFTATPLPTATGFPDCDPSGNSGFENDLLLLINGERESEGLPAYAPQGQLKAAALAHNTDMACNGIFSHTGSDGSKAEDRVTAQGYDWTSVGENIFGVGDTTATAPQLAFNFWMASPPNQANILNNEFTDIGIGYTYEPNSPFGGYFTVVFAWP